MWDFETFLLGNKVIKIYFVFVFYLGEHSFYMYLNDLWIKYIVCEETPICWLSCLFSSPDPKGHVSYSHHLASVVVVRRLSSVVRRKLFKKSSPLKVLDQWKPNLVWIITRVSIFKIVSGDAVHQPTWPLLLKIEHMVKLQVFGNNSKTVNNIKNLKG